MNYSIGNVVSFKDVNNNLIIGKIVYINDEYNKMVIMCDDGRHFAVPDINEAEIYDCLCLI